MKTKLPMDRICYTCYKKTMRNRQQPTSGMEWNTMLGLTERLKRDRHFRDYMLITTGCYFGLRISDLLKIRWNEINAVKEIQLVEHKTKKKRRITINPAVHSAAKVFVSALEKKGKYRDNAYVFANRWGDPITVSYVNKRLKQLFQRYNVSVKNPSSHTLRKTFGKRVYESDGKSERALIYLSEIFSHSSISVTRRYIGITQEQIADVYMSI